MPLKSACPGEASLYYSTTPAGVPMYTELELGRSIFCKFDHIVRLLLSVVKCCSISVPSSLTR